MHGHIYNLSEKTNQAKAHDAHNQVGQKQANKDSIYIRCLFHKKQRTGLQALHHQRTHHDGCSSVTGNTQGQHRNEGPAGNSIIASLRGTNALRLAVAEIATMLGPALSLIIGYKRSNIAAGTGHTTNKSTDKGGAQKGSKNTLHICQRGQQAVNYHMLLTALIMIIFFNTTQNLSKGKNANQNRNKGHAA